MSSSPTTIFHPYRTHEKCMNVCIVLPPSSHHPPSLCHSETHTHSHRFLSVSITFIPLYISYIYIYESIKCRLCLSGTKTLKRIIGHFSCLSSVLRVQSRSGGKEEGIAIPSFSFQLVRGKKLLCFRKSRISIHQITLSLDFRGRATDLLLHPNLCLRTSYT